MLFFFQAEDGIRDIGVTGVQTCALPILALRVFAGALGRRAVDWRARLLRATALLEATIDFAEEEVPDDLLPEDRKSVVLGKSVDLRGRRLTIKKKQLFITLFLLLLSSLL